MFNPDLPSPREVNCDSPVVVDFLSAAMETCLQQYLARLGCMNYAKLILARLVSDGTINCDSGSQIGLKPDLSHFKPSWFN